MTSCTSENPKRAEWQAVQLRQRKKIKEKRNKKKKRKKKKKKRKNRKKKTEKTEKKKKRKKEKTQKKDITLPRHTHKEFSDIRVVSPVSTDNYWYS